MLSHWRGQQGFMWSFWVNLVGLRLAVFAIQSAFYPDIGHDYTAYAIEFLLFAAFAHGVVLVWQIVGVLRAGERFISSGGSFVNVWGSYLGLLIAFWISLSFAFEIWQWTLPYPGKNQQARRVDQFEFAIDKTGTIAHISGDIGFGITRKFRAFLKKHPDIKMVVLNSSGGNVYEARGIAKLIRDREIATRVEKLCYSSCTTIFIGGKTRSLAKSATLGFHQYRMAVEYQVGLVDIEREYIQDRALFLSAGVKSSFVDKMFAYKPDEMWFPNIEELRRAGVVTTAKYNMMGPRLPKRLFVWSNFFHASVDGNTFNQGKDLHAFF